jgi:ribosomal protein S18 acetylase RimI-like enzyme
MIRFAEYEDFNQIHEILKDLHGLHVKGEPNYYKKADAIISVKEFNDEIDKGHVLVYECDSKILGYIMFYEMIITNNPIIKDQKVLFINDLCVLHSERGKGIGRQLFCNIERFAKDNQYTDIELNVWSFNINAFKFYKSMGMRETRIKMGKRIL